MIFTNIWDLLKDMLLTGSMDILPADSPPYYGWVCQKTEKMWQITVSNVIRSLEVGNIEDITMVRQHLSNRRDNGGLSQLLSKLPYLAKLNDLKAFW